MQNLDKFTVYIFCILVKCSSVLLLLMLQVVTEVHAEEPTMSSFPLSEKYTYRLCCISCFGESEPLKLLPSHRCRYDLLAVQDKTSKLWFRVRSGQSHKSFRGVYDMCRDWKRSERCPKGESCRFAHGKPEVLLFTLEKDKKFNITEFISEARLQYTDVMSDTHVKQVIISHNYVVILCFITLVLLNFLIFF